jgi:antitoxin HicB
MRTPGRPDFRESGGLRRLSLSIIRLCWVFLVVQSMARDSRARVSLESVRPGQRSGRGLHLPGPEPMSPAREHAESALERYVGLPYHLSVVREGEEKDKPWTASVEELPGCTSRGKTADEAVGGVQEAMLEWIRGAIAEGREIPEPRSTASHSGRLLLRMPRSLHGELTRAAERESVSLNQFINDTLASAVAWRGRSPSTPGGNSAGPIQTPGAEGLTAEPSASRPARRDTSRLVMIALAANFIVVVAAGIVAIIVLVAAWL